MGVLSYIPKLHMPYSSGGFDRVGGCSREEGLCPGGILTGGLSGVGLTRVTLSDGRFVRLPRIDFGGATIMYFNVRMPRQLIAHMPTYDIESCSCFYCR